ncbi:flagellin FlaF [Thermococcus sp. AM4]|uniref:flagellin FlaF n=1 Tax=Thermococcus sp. (strain AM4) TaxID=246969 RepID=UPI000187133B|nr:flagellin FlaF [Thermococcus sp. AM4]EEB74197.1 Flagellin FlaF [Thermococcus sp. AM4]
MGFSVSASAAIIFISFLIAATTLYTAWDNSYNNVQAAQEDWYNLRVSQVHFSINVIDLNRVDIDGDGYDDLEIDFTYGGIPTKTVIDVLLDGVYHNRVTSSKLKYLIPGNSYAIYVQNGVPDTNSHRVILAFKNGCKLIIQYHYSTTQGDVVLDSQPVTTCPVEVS